MTIMIPERNWRAFLDDLSDRRKDWETRIEVVGADLGDQTLEKGLPLVGISTDERDRTIEVLLGQDAEHHFSHVIRSPKKVSYLATDGDINGVVEFEDEEGTKTLIHLGKPGLPVASSEKGMTTA